MLYTLIITDTEMCYEGHTEDFFIGVFLSKQDANRIAENYLKNIEGFCDHNCTYRIIEKQVLGNYEKKVWIVVGWNENEKGDEINIIESQFFGSEKQAETEMMNMKGIYKRTNWSIDRYCIGEMLWEQGFVRT